LIARSRLNELDILTSVMVLANAQVLVQFEVRMNQHQRARLLVQAGSDRLR
jgi:hypothetical protein